MEPLSSSRRQFSSSVLTPACVAGCRRAQSGASPAASSWGGERRLSRRGANEGGPQARALRSSTAVRSRSSWRQLVRKQRTVNAISCSGCNFLHSSNSASAQLRVSLLASMSAVRSSSYAAGLLSAAKLAAMAADVWREKMKR